jgi:membrane-bound inhibitor of C-type lysozyme
MIAERGDRSILMFSVPSGSSAKYQGGDYSFWEHQGEARVTWGYGAEEMLCKPTPQDDK